MVDISDLEERHRKAVARAEKARLAYENASSDLARVETALSVVREMAGVGNETIQSALKLTDRQQIMFGAIEIGENQGLSPVEIYSKLKSNSFFDGSVTYVRTTLWRMAENNKIGSANGKYWRWPESADFSKADVVLPPVSEWAGSPPENEEENRFVPWDDDSEVPF
jgi:hypothetical protein